MATRTKTQAASCDSARRTAQKKLLDRKEQRLEREENRQLGRAEHRVEATVSLSHDKLTNAMHQKYRRRQEQTRQQQHRIKECHDQLSELVRRRGTRVCKG